MKIELLTRRFLIMEDLFLSGLTVSAIEGNQIYGTVDILFGKKNYRATYTYALGAGVSIEGFTCLDTNMFSLGGVFILGKDNIPVSKKIIDFIEGIFIHNTTKCHSLIPSDYYGYLDVDSLDRLCPPMWQGQHHKQSYGIHPVLKDNDHPYLYWYSVIYEDTLYKMIRECEYFPKWQDEIVKFDIRELSTYTPPKSWREEGTKEYVVPIIRSAVRKGEIIPI